MVRLRILSCRKRVQQAGLTLIEVLIALAIIGTAMTAVIKATSQNINASGYLQRKTIAMWVGLQVMNELRAGVLKEGSSGSQKLTTEMLGREWFWQTVEEETPNPNIKKIMVKVFENEEEEEEAAPIITLESFLYYEG